MTPNPLTQRTREQVERVVRAVEEARSRTAAATPRNARPPWPPVRTRTVRAEEFETHDLD
jgi:hypothetical protein